MTSRLTSSFSKGIDWCLSSVAHHVTSFTAGPLSFSRLNSTLYQGSRGRDMYLAVAAGLAGYLLPPALSSMRGVASNQFVKTSLYFLASSLFLNKSLAVFRDRLFVQENFDQKLDLLQKDVEHAVRYRYFQKSTPYFAARTHSLFSRMPPHLMRNPERANNLKLLLQDRHPLNQNSSEALRALKITCEMDELLANVYRARTVPEKRQMEQKFNELVRAAQSLPQSIQKYFACSFANFYGSHAQFLQTLPEVLNYVVNTKDGWDFLERVLGKPVNRFNKRAVEEAVKNCCSEIEQGYLTIGAKCNAQIARLSKKLIQQLQKVEEVTGFSTQETSAKVEKMIAEFESTPTGVLPACLPKDVISFFLTDTCIDSPSFTDFMTLCSQQRGEWAERFVSHKDIQTRIQKSSPRELQSFVLKAVKSPDKTTLLATFFKFAGLGDQKRFFECLPYGYLGDVLASLPKDLQELDLSACVKSMKDRHLLFLTKRDFPRLKRLNLSGCSHLSESALKTFVSAPGMSQLRDLNLSTCRVTDAVVKGITANPSRVYLKSLNISKSCLASQITDASLEAIANDLYLWDLEDLNLTGSTPITDRGIQLLAGSKKMGRLRNLILTACPRLTSISLQAIGASKHLSKLESLSMAMCPLIANAGVLAIANSPSMSNLSNFCCSGCPLIDDGAALAIARSVYMRSLSVLSLSSPLITDASAISIANSPHVTALETLEMYGSPSITDATPKALANSPNMAKIRKLKFLNCPSLTNNSVQSIVESDFIHALEELDFGDSPNLTDDSVQAIAASKKMKNLKLLNISRSKITNTGLSALAASFYMSQLQILGLSLCADLQDAGVRSLAESEYLQNIEKLYLGGCSQLTNAAAQSIAASANMSLLRELDFSDCPLIQDEGVRAIAESPHLDSLRAFGMRNNPVDLQSALHFGRKQKNVIVLAYRTLVNATEARWVNFLHPHNAIIRF